MKDYDAQSLRADLNVDGLWDTEDLDRWTTRFYEDYDKLNN